MISSKTITLSTLWSEIKSSTHKPFPGSAAISRIDAESLILDTKTQNSILIYFFIAILTFAGIPLLTLIIHSSVNLIFSEQSQGMGLDFIILNAIAVIAFLFLLYILCLFALYTIFTPTPSPLIFNRKLGKVYGSHMGRAIELDWKNIRPITTQAVLMLNGIQRSYNLVLFQPNKPEAWHKPGRKKGIGIIATTGEAWGVGNCESLWEFIRIYMTENPKEAAEILPEVEIQSPQKGWVSAILDDGPYYDSTESGDRMHRLRQSEGQPEISWAQSLYVGFMAPGSLLSMLTAFLRPKVKLPAACWPKPFIQSTPYKTVMPSASDEALRRKAALRVLPWLIVTISLGSLVWVALTWLVTRAA